MEPSYDLSQDNTLVLCRFRPHNDFEREFSSKEIVEIAQDSQSVTIFQTKEKGEPLSFPFDYVFDENDTQSTVYEKAARPIVDGVMEGVNGTIFAYGQTSGGKTYTMTGPNFEDPVDMGLIPRMITNVFYQIENSLEHLEFTVRVSYSEIYMEKIRDLLAPEHDNLKIRENKIMGVYVEGITESYTSTGDEVFEWMKYGTKNRTVGANNMNMKSSRSHAIFSMTVSQTNKLDYTTRIAKLHMVDLAGSEKVSKTGAEGLRLEEAKLINKSLTTLGIVITALTESKKSHVPYRSSKLTRLLQQSLGGNGKMSLIICCSPSLYNEQETISSLRFGARAKLIKNTPKVNREYTLAELKLLLAQAREEIRRKDKRIKVLEDLLRQAGIAIPEMVDLDESDFEDEYRDGAYADVIQELEDLRSRLSEEVENSLKLKEDVKEAQTESEEYKSVYSVMEQHIKYMDSQIKNFENSQKEKEDLIEKLTVGKESYEAELSAITTKMLEQEQKLNEREVEIEILKNKLKNMKGDVVQQQRTEEDQRNEVKKEIYRKYTVSHQLPPIKESTIESVSDEVYDEQKWREEKRKMIRDLQKRISQVVDLELALEEARENYATLELTMSEGERALKKKTDVLERNLEQLTLMYHQLASQKSALSVDKQVAERKSQRLQEKIRILEDQLKKANVELDKCQREIKYLTETFEKTSKLSMLGSSGGLGAIVPSGRIRKSIKGGVGSFKPQIPEVTRNYSVSINM
ncbi:unnamed protein product [Blepharisma stoltei]|uniref:Kinesin-like protein n=1 Tax=Blepharisma stoltei TaxID=1481888 RepID=A0AAU9I7B3_9CILI|nr:unnamed protein product [Blepharisma stoltei]